MPSRLGQGLPARPFPEAGMAHPALRAGEEGRSVTLRKEIPPLQQGGFNSQLTELSTAYARLLKRSTYKFPAWQQPMENLKQILHLIKVNLN